MTTPAPVGLEEVSAVADACPPSVPADRKGEPDATARPASSGPEARPSPKRRDRRQGPAVFRIGSVVCGLAVGSAGAGVLVGWALDVDALKGGLPESVHMNPTTAVAFLLSSSSLLILREERRSLAATLLARCLAATALLTGAARLAGYAFGFDPGLDRLLFAERMRHLPPGLPNQIALPTALGFVLLGSALLAIDLRTRRGRFPAAALAIAACLIGLFAVVGYLQGAGSIYGSSTYRPMAVSTAFCLAILGTGIVLARPDRGFGLRFASPGPGGQLARALFPAVLVIPVVLGCLKFAGERAGLYSRETGLALLVVSHVVVFGGLIVWAATLLDRADDDRARAAHETRRLQGFLDSIVENIPHMIFVKDAEDLRFVRFNRAGEKLLGYRREELIGKSDDDFFPKEQAEFFKGRDRVVLESGLPLEIPEEPVRTHEGDRILATKKVPILDERGRPLYLLGISEDITDRKRAADAIVDLNRSLKSNAERLEAANKELEAFGYSVSHDLRAPLRHIDGFADMLTSHASPTLDETGKRYLRVISDSARRMGVLIDDLLAFSRMGRVEMRRERVSLADLVKDARADLVGEESGRAVDWRIGPLPEIEGDRNMIRLVLVNLISNALKYTRTRDRARIEIGARDAASEVALFVRDNGVGFDPQYADKLFGVFQRLHRSDEFEGTGVGLANVRRIVGRHGGRVRAEGEVDRGATFTVTFPKQGREA